MDLQKIKEQIDNKLKRKFDIVTTIDGGNGDWENNRVGSWPPSISFYEDTQCLNLFLNVQGKTFKLELTEWTLNNDHDLRVNRIGVYGPRMVDKLLKQIFKTLSTGVYTCADVVHQTGKIAPNRLQALARRSAAKKDK